jgi:hypothetical protein
MSPGERVSFNDRFWRSIDLTRKEYGYGPGMMHKMQDIAPPH